MCQDKNEVINYYRDDGESEQQTFVRLKAYFQFWTKLPYVLRFACVYVGVFDQHIQCATALTLIFIHNMRFHCKRNSALEWKKLRQSTRRTKDKTNKNMWVSF